MSDSGSEESDELWLLNLQEFLEAVQPQLKDLQSLTQVEEFVATLESTDPNFHRYNFISQIRDRLESDLSPLIDKLILDKHSNEETLAPNIGEDLLESREFRHLSSNIIGSVQTASENVTNHINSDTFDFSGQIPTKYGRQTNYFNPSSSVCSTTDGMEFMFMPPDRYKTLAKEIDPLKPLDQRLKALSILQQVPQTDLVASDAWELTRQGLLKALNDENEDVSSKALKFLSRLFATGSSHVIKEYFLLLIENLVDYFLDSTSHMVLLESGLDLGDRRNILLVKKFRLLNDIQKELPTTWFRYSEKYVEEMIESVIGLLGVSPPKIASTGDSPLMNPLHFLSLVDPQAVWFKKWMHGFYSRFHLVASISKHSSFLKRPIKSCIEICKKIHNLNKEMKDLTSREVDVAFETCDIVYLHFIHSLNFLSRLMLYKNGRSLLHFELHNGKILDINMLIVAFIDIMKLYPASKSMIQNTQKFHGGLLAAECFRLISNADIETVQSCLCFDSLYQSIIQAIKQQSSSLPLVIEILAEIAISTEGCRQLLLHRIVSGYDIPVSVIDVVASSFVRAPIEDLQSSSLLPLMNLFQRIFRISDGLILLSSYNIHIFLANVLTMQNKESNVLLEKLKSTITDDSPVSPQTPSSCGGSGSGSARKSTESMAYKKSIQIEKQILETILHLALTPKGFSLALQCDMFEVCVAYFGNRIKERERTARNGYGVVMSHLTSTAEGINALLVCGYVKYLLKELWYHLEGSTNDCTVTVLQEIPRDFTGTSSRKLFLSICELVSTVHSVRALLHQQQPSPSEPYCLDAVMKEMVLLTASTSALFHEDESHYFALNILSYMVTSLDTMLYLQARYNFQKTLLQLQAASFHEEAGVFILDQNSIKRNEILVQTFLLGGPSEKKIPPQTLSNDNVTPFSWPLFSTYPVPGVYSSQGFFSTSSVANDNLSKLSDLLTNTNQDGSLATIQEIQRLFQIEIQNRTLKCKGEMVLSLLETQIKLMVECDQLDGTHSENQRHGEDEEKSIIKNKTITEEDEIAISMLVRYGVTLRQLESEEESVKAFRRLLRLSKNHFQKHHAIVKEGFDWFLGVIFLLFEGEEQRAWTFLKEFSKLWQSVYLWPCSLIKEKSKAPLIQPVFTQTCHWIENILRDELPQIYAAFKVSGLPPSQICLFWLQQSFLNYLDWTEIVWYMTCCVVMGVDYQVYFTVSIFKHLHQEILEQSQENNLLLFLRTTPIFGYRFNAYLEFMKDLEEKYKKKIAKSSPRRTLKEREEEEEENGESKESLRHNSP